MNSNNAIGAIYKSHVEADAAVKELHSAFVATMQVQLAALSRDVSQLAAKLEKSSDAVRVQAKPKLQALCDQTTQLNKQLDHIKNATECTWKNTNHRPQGAYEPSGDGFSQARASG